MIAASQYQRHGETRATKDTELLTYKAQIDEQYEFLLTAAVLEPDGKTTVIRYSRKTKEQYVRSEDDGKPTGWSAYYSGGSWKATAKGK